MKVLIGCEFSGVVRDAFIKEGHDAMSCDLIPSESPGPHYQGNVLDILNDDWDLAIFHPPCTYLSKSGVRWLYTEPERWKLLIDGAVFFRDLLQANIPRVAVENPVMHNYASRIIGRKHDQVLHPWQFGHPERKATCLWLKNLPPLVPTTNLKQEMLSLPGKQSDANHYLRPGEQRGKLRSITYTGIAEAMSKQWTT